MPRKKANLLPPATRDEIAAELDRVNTLLGQLDQAEQCGVDCQDYRRGLRQTHAELTAILRHAYGDTAPDATSPP